MQQAYRALRVVAEAQTIRIVLDANPGELMLTELCTACASLNTAASIGVKAVVLDFKNTAGGEEKPASSASVDRACAAIWAVGQPVLAVIRVSLVPTLVHAADLTLAAHDAVLTLADNDTITGRQAARIGYITWSASAWDLDREMERILDMLRSKSAIALHLTKASVGVGAGELNNPGALSEACCRGAPCGYPFNSFAPTPRTAAERLEAFQQVNTLYLNQVMQTVDAHEGLKACLEKRKPQWKNQ
jgi:hypothetical protein